MTGAMDDGLSLFLQLRPRLFAIARRMLGNNTEAEDVLQDVWLRWQTAQRSQVRDAPAFLATATARVAITRAKSARARREQQLGLQLREPCDTSADPSSGAARGEASRLAVVLLLERLSPSERAAYVLREAFNYEYPRIAQVIRTTGANCRQLVARARKHLAQARRAPVDPTRQFRLLEAFSAAAQHGELLALEELFASAAV